MNDKENFILWANKKFGPSKDLCQTERFASYYECWLDARDPLQAKIDVLMLEYCPKEMTKEQIEKWEKHQKPYDL
jgi:hypothetical protein